MNQHVNLWSLKSKEMNIDFFFGLRFFEIFSGNCLWQLFHINLVSMSNIPTIQSTCISKSYTRALQSGATLHNYGQS